MKILLLVCLFGTAFAFPYQQLVYSMSTSDEVPFYVFPRSFPPQTGSQDMSYYPIYMFQQPAQQLAQVPTQLQGMRHPLEMMAPQAGTGGMSPEQDSNPAMESSEELMLLAGAIRKMLPGEWPVAAGGGLDAEPEGGPAPSEAVIPIPSAADAEVPGATGVEANGNALAPMSLPALDINAVLSLEPAKETEASSVTVNKP
ncbi:uncharacterized protein LOC102362180 isoform X3 [Latimeria chalumnae]|uniref:uncharacterized protein LOC102362180 isoform X3 n=1 Tax=Latimeria chalumnae TaxID=7897 RepID=UPI0003C110B7|nr:PREDICTED: uncharacterized protein LOC102362180 isoform X3 [Latimeria chalumnae]|eukprot:XP_006010028.1 PREDICTED: uncharacterized protein LOC102362180 isoform X3 [Latimeria chalumnae]